MGAATFINDLKVTARRRTTIKIAKMNRYIKLSSVDSLISLLINESEITPYSRGLSEESSLAGF